MHAEKEKSETSKRHTHLTLIDRTLLKWKSTNPPSNRKKKKIHAVYAEEKLSKYK